MIRVQKKLNNFLKKEIDRIKSVQFIEQLTFEQLRELSVDDEEEDYQIN